MYAIASALVALLATLLALVQPQIPAPTGYVNDFAHVLSTETQSRLDALAKQVRDRSGGEIAVVTLPNLGGRPVEEISLRILREWGVGAKAQIGQQTRNAGTVILLVPKETSDDGHGHCRIEVGQGAEGFLTDADAGTYCRDATPLFVQRDYNGALAQITNRVAAEYAKAFNIAVDTEPTALPPLEPGAPDVDVRGPRRRRRGINPIAALLEFFNVL